MGRSTVHGLGAVVCGRRLTNAEFFEPVLFRQKVVACGPELPRITRVTGNYQPIH